MRGVVSPQKSWNLTLSPQGPWLQMRTNGDSRKLLEMETDINLAPRVSFWTSWCHWKEEEEIYLFGYL